MSKFYSGSKQALYPTFASIYTRCLSPPLSLSLSLSYTAALKRTKCGVAN